MSLPEVHQPGPLVVEIDRTGMAFLALSLSFLSAFCWGRVWYKPGKDWPLWAALGCVLTLLFFVAALTWLSML